MKKDEIRLQYSGFVVFAAQMLSIVTGLVFTLLLTRNMTQPEYGIWANIFDVIGYFLLLSGVFPFWTMRFVARRQQGAAKTGLLANLFVSLIFLSLYVLIAPVLTHVFNIGPTYSIMYLIAGAQIVNMYLIVVLESILRAKKPQAIGYGLLIEEICKIVLAYTLIVILHQLFVGALLSLILAATAQVLFYLRLTASEYRPRIQWNYIREWLKGSTVNLYNAAGTQLAALTIILLFVYGGQAARGDFQAASTYAAIIGYPLFLAYALYPRLLTKDSHEDVTFTLKTVLMFAIPLVTIILSVPQSLLTILNVHYSEATPILLLLTIDTFIVLITQFYSSVIFGAEKLDEDAKIPFKQLVKSKIFKVFSLPYIQAAITIPTSLYFLTQYSAGNSVLAAVIVVAANLVAHTTMLLIQYAMMHNSVPVVFPWKSTGKYVSASVVAAIFLHFVPHPTTLLSTFIVVIVGALIYTSVLLAIDRDARKIVVAIWNEFESIDGKDENLTKKKRENG